MKKPLNLLATETNLRANAKKIKEAMENLKLAAEWYRGAANCACAMETRHLDVREAARNNRDAYLAKGQAFEAKAMALLGDQCAL